MTVDDATLGMTSDGRDLVKEAEDAERRYHATPRWRVFRRTTHFNAYMSAVGLLAVAERERLDLALLARRRYPYEEGDTTVLGPEIFASRDHNVVCWKGENYVRQAPVAEVLARGIPDDRKLATINRLVHGATTRGNGSRYDNR